VSSNRIWYLMDSDQQSYTWALNIVRSNLYQLCSYSFSVFNEGRCYAFENWLVGKTWSCLEDCIKIVSCYLKKKKIKLRDIIWKLFKDNHPLRKSHIFSCKLKRIWLNNKSITLNAHHVLSWILDVLCMIASMR